MNESIVYEESKREVDRENWEEFGRVRSSKPGWSPSEFRAKRDLSGHNKRKSETCLARIKELHTVRAEAFETKDSHDVAWSSRDGLLITIQRYTHC